MGQYSDLLNNCVCSLRIDIISFDDVSDSSALDFRQTQLTHLTSDQDNSPITRGKYCHVEAEVTHIF
jgi:hypothetical protein